jgi:hypothetical protein
VVAGVVAGAASSILPIFTSDLDRRAVPGLLDVGYGHHAKSAGLMPQAGCFHPRWFGGPIQRNRKFADSALERDGFELPVPRRACSAARACAEAKMSRKIRLSIALVGIGAPSEDVRQSKRSRIDARQNPTDEAGDGGE